jgi:hypothetical protein
LEHVQAKKFVSRRTLPSKFIVFRTRGKIFNPQDCHLVFNSNEIGQPEDPERIYEIERIYNDGPTKSSKLLGVLFDEYLSFDAHITTKEGLFCLFGIFVPISRHTPPPPPPPTCYTKFIVFRTRGKIINPQDCHLVFNSNEIGQPEDPERIYEIERIYNDGPTKSFKLLGVLFDEYLSFDAHITTKEGLFCLFGIFVPISRHTPPPPHPQTHRVTSQSKQTSGGQSRYFRPPPTPSPLHENPAYL